jgi:dephospho-CoA kinase
MLAGLGACVIDADAISRRLTEAQGAAMPAIAAQFGAEFVNTQGALDRDRMRAHVFARASAKAELEAIIHPLVAQEINTQAQAAVAQGFSTLVFDIPLLVESGRRWREQIDRVLVIDCLVETQIQRVMARSHLPREAVEKVIAAQATRNQRLHAADWVIENDQVSLAELLQRVSTLPIKS